MVFILHFTPSLHFALSLPSGFYPQSAFYPLSAVCSPQSTVCVTLAREFNIVHDVSSVFGQRFALCSLHSAICSLQSPVSSLRSAVCSFRSVVCSLHAVCMQSAACSLQPAVCSCRTPQRNVYNLSLFCIIQWHNISCLLFPHP